MFNLTTKKTLFFSDCQRLADPKVVYDVDQQRLFVGNVNPELFSSNIDDNRQLDATIDEIRAYDSVVSGIYFIIIFSILNF